MGEKTIMGVIGKRFKRNGAEYEVIAYDEANKYMVMKDISKDFNGNLEFLCDASYEDGMLKGSKALQYTVTTEECYDDIRKSNADNIDDMAEAIRKAHHHIPKIFCRLIAETYSNI